MGAMKTPGVYIVEKSAFPNSVVEVATAVPAFIGYTNRADNKGKSLSSQPWRITSMAEFESYFGGAPTLQFSLTVDSTAPIFSMADSKGKKNGYQLGLAAGQSKFQLYYNMKMFFQNGGGACYIVSVGNYKDSIDKEKLAAGVDLLIKEQEPTMVVIPDAISLGTIDDCIGLQQHMLDHCGNVMRNRVAILDVYDGYRARQDPAGDPVNDFRGKLGINFLDYGMAYYPWVNTTITPATNLSYENLDSSSMDILKGILKDELGIEATAPAKDPELTRYDNKLSIVNGVVAAPAGDVDLANAVAVAAVDALDTATKAFDKAGKAVPPNDTAVAAATTAKDNATAADAAAKALVAAVTAAAEDAVALEAAKSAYDATPEVVATRLTLKDVQHKLLQQAASNKKTMIVVSPNYNMILTEMANQINLLPPSAAMAGIYTMVDNNRGVWKAPANVSLNAVISPTVNISHNDQEDLNVTPQGKSINAIRTFVGEGTLVWGARTLDGNSLDWRYINVRRTMIMLEESVRLASKAYVFEPNVANTWVTIKSMIRNFLTGIWKKGGLAGASPDDAFGVFVGLGETMTPDDILEGILRVTVLVAISRPAEFIEITFQQQMQKS